jgi:hypothetical protein
MSYTVKFLLVMFSMALTDVCWAYYFIKVGERKAVQAGTWAVLLFFAGAIVTTNYVGDHSMMIAAAIGSFVGTWITVKYKKHKENEQTRSN